MTEEEFKVRLADFMAARDFAGATHLAMEYAGDSDANDERLAACCYWLEAQGVADHAKPIVERALAVNDDRPKLQRVRLEALIAAKQSDTALAACAELLKRHPGNIDYLAVQSAALRSLGRTDEAIESLRRVLRADPYSQDAHFQLSSMIKYDKTMAEYQMLLDARDHAAQTGNQNVALLFAALGKAHEDCGDFDDAFAAYQAFNTIQRQSEPYAEDAWAAETAAMERRFPKALFETKTRLGPSDAAPIFVFGLPRSGTTLTEQILARHSQTNAIGETDVIPIAFGNWQKKWAVPGSDPFGQDALADAADMILSRNAPYGTSAAGASGLKMVDKSLSNFRYLGFLHFVFPKAHFVYCTRNPLDTAVSIHATFFGAGLSWTNDLKDIGRFMRRHQKLMRHWRATLPRPIHVVRYEDLISDTEPHARQLLEACDLPWEEACLEPGGGNRAINTASVVQARQPIYKTSMGRAARFDTHLAPLKAALGKAANPDWFEA